MANNRCAQIVEAAKYLESVGMTQAQLSALHHFAPKGRAITYALVYTYFGVDKNLRDRNLTFGERLAYVAYERRSGRRDFTELITEALRKWPF